MTIKITLFLAICFCIVSCNSSDKDFDKPYEMTVQVLDMNGKTVKNRRVNLVISRNLRPDSARTDNDGIVTFNYSLHGSNFSNDNVIIKVEDDPLFQAINLIEHSTFQPSGRITETIRMDSLVPFKTRIKMNRNNIDNVSIRIESEKKANNSNIDKVFRLSNIDKPASFVDTTLTTMVYSKAIFSIKNYVDCSDGSRFEGILYVIQRNVDRNSVFLYEMF